MTEEQKKVIIKSRNSGLGYGTIAKDMGLTKEALEDGSLECWFYGGKVKKWQRT